METMNDNAAEELLRLIDAAEFTRPSEGPLKLWELGEPDTRSAEIRVWFGPASLLGSLLCGFMAGLMCSVSSEAKKLAVRCNFGDLLIQLERLHPGRVQRRDGNSMKAWQVRSPSAAVRKTGVELIREERERQISDEGWTPEHDDQHACGELLDAALSYGHAAINVGHPCLKEPPAMWPWEAEWWKPSKDRIRNLVKMGALAAAEIDRLQRLDAN